VHGAWTTTGPFQYGPGAWPSLAAPYIVSIDAAETSPLNRFLLCLIGAKKINLIWRWRTNLSRLRLQSPSATLTTIPVVRLTPLLPVEYIVCTMNGIFTCIALITTLYNASTACSWVVTACNIVVSNYHSRLCCSIAVKHLYPRWLNVILHALSFDFMLSCGYLTVVRHLSSLTCILLTTIRISLCKFCSWFHAVVVVTRENWAHFKHCISY